MPGGLYQKAVEVAKEYIRAGDIFQVVLAQRYDLRPRRRPVRRLPRAAPGEPEPVHVLPAAPRGDDRRRRRRSRWCRCSARKVISRPIAGTRRRGRRRRGRPAHGRGAAGEPEGGRRARDARRPRPQRRRPRRQVRHGEGRRADDDRALQPRDAPHLAGRRRAGRRQGPDRRAAGDAAGGHRVSGAPKVRAMEIIDELEPVKRGPYAGVVGYVDFSGNLDTAIAIRTMFVGPAAPPTCRPAPGSSPTASPTTKTSSAATRPPRCSPPSPRRGG